MFLYREKKQLICTTGKTHNTMTPYSYIVVKKNVISKKHKKTKKKKKENKKQQW